MAEQSKTVDQALRLLIELRDHGGGTAAELGRRIGISRTAASRLLASLEAYRFARRTDTGFDLGFDLLQFNAGLGQAIRRAAAESLHDLVSEFNETAVLAVRDEDDAVALEQIVARQRVVNVHYRPGTRHPLSVGAHGLAMLADVHRPPQDYDRALLPRLAEIARIGYAVSHDELEPGVTGVAAPIVSGTGRPIAAIGVVAPTIRFPSIPGVAESVITAARTISHHLLGEEPYEPARATRPIHLPSQAAH